MRNGFRSFSVIATCAVLLLSIFACDLPTLTPPYDVYVATAGNDSNDCRSATHACRTVQAALDKSVTGSNIIIGAGTFTAGLSLRKIVTIRGAGQTRTIINALNNTTPIIDIQNYITTTLNDLTLAHGGIAIMLRGRNASITANNLTITSSEYGIENSVGGRITLTNTTITGSTRIGIENYGTLQATGLTMRSNAISAILNHGVADLTNATFQQNGDAIILGSDPGRTPRLTATNATITANTGYAISNQGGTVTITTGTISNNGFGVYNYDDPTPGTVTMTNATISNNRSGGFYNRATLVLQNVVISANTGPGIDTYAGSVQVTNAAIIRGGDAGLDVHGGIATATNLTVSGNHRIGVELMAGSLDLSYSTVAFNNLLGLYENTGVMLTVQNSIVELNTPQNCSLSGTHTFTGPNILCDDTVTATSLHLGALTPAAGTSILPLLARSPAIDAASGACPATDQRGYARPYGSACDLGAFEFGSSMAIVAGTPGTGTPTSQVLEIVTPTGTATPTPTAPAAPQAKITKNAFCRKGPGTAYFDVTSLAAGTQVQVEGRTDSALRWWWVLIPGGSDHCWVSDSNLELSGPADQLPVQAAPPLPQPPTGFSDASACVKKAKNRTVTLTWKTSPGATGYRVYRDGILLDELGAGATSYTDTSLSVKDYTYTIEAINANGKSIGVDTISSRCP
jgi:hypothetical protein